MPRPRRPDPKATRDIYLRRLERLIRIRTDYREDLNEIGIDLLTFCIDATHQDADTFGGREQANALLFPATQHDNRERTP